MAINGKIFLEGLNELEASKGISKEVIIAALKEAMTKGYKKQIGATEEDDCVRVTIDAENGIIDMYQIKKVVKEVEDDFLEISVEDANALKDGKKYKAGDELIIPSSPEELTKAIAMSVKSILKQKLAEAEKDVLFENFKDKIGTMITGKVEKADERGLTINIGRTSVFLPRKQMIGDEKFNVGESIKLFVNNVDSGTKGAHIVVTRSGEGFLKCLFTEEISEVYNGTIVIKGIAREAGERSKVAVYTDDPNVDPAGACIGPNGSRIQKVVGQLGNGQSKEKIDIIAYSDVPGLFIMEALKPAHVVGIKVDEESKSALAIVKDDSFSLAIGKKGVNVRLAVKLTGYNIDVKTESQALEDNLEYTSFEEVQALEDAKREQAQIRVAQEEQNTPISVLPGLPEGYVAPQDRVYEEESDDDDEDLNEALEAEVEKKEAEPVEAPVVEETPVIEEAPVVKEEKPAKVEKKEEEVRREVKTTTSIEDLEKSLADESARKASKPGKKNFKKNSKKAEEEEEETEKPVIATGERMSIYTEEELRQMEEEDKAAEEEYDEEEVDYDEYDDYYDDDGR
jgi:N utilization substance protein A